MRHLRCVMLVLLSAILLPGVLEAQQGSTAAQRGAPEHGFRVLQNYPNPFRGETRIPFELHDAAFPEGRPAVVSVRIYNVLREYVASPTALAHPAGDGVPVVDLDYSSPGRHEVFWDGRDRSGVLVPQGVYFLEMTVNGRPQAIRMLAFR
jgi:hypothetical protein